MDANDYEKERDLLKQLGNKEIRAFRRFYKEYSDDLLILAYMLLESNTKAIKAVDELFERLWLEAKFEYIEPPIHKFLVSELHKSCIKRN
jgi:hypothetical protein